MKQLLTAALAFLLLSACATVPQTPQPARFKILQINDVYKIEGLEGGASGGLARVRTLRKHLESDGTPVLVLHGGDALYPSVMSKYLEARPMIDVMNLLDGDAAASDPHLIATFGNHEFDKGDDRIVTARLRESQFRWVASNTLHCTAGTCDKNWSAVAPTVHETILLDVDGTRVGLFGLLLPLSRSYVKSTDTLTAARASVASLRKNGARVVIAVTHQDMPDDAALARDVPGIDVVIGGHDHLFMQRRVGDVWVTKADADAKSVVVYDITVPASGAIRTAPVRVTLDTTVPRDPMVDERVRHWVSQLATTLGGNEVIGTTRNLLEGIEPAVRGRETALGNLLTDAARARMNTDIAFIGGGGIRINDNIPPGPITRYDMEGVFFYDNTLVSIPLTGAQLLDILRNSVSRADSGDGRFLQVSGLRFSYRKEGDRFVVDPVDVTVGGAPLDPDRRYTATTTSFLHERGTEDDYALFAEATRPPRISDDTPDFRKTVESYIRALPGGVVTTGVEGRIVRRQ